MTTAIEPAVRPSAAAEAPEMRLVSIRYAADGINLYEFRPLAGGEVPLFTAGAHIDLHLPNGMVRPYSLLNAPGERQAYLIGVKREAAGRGGSRYIHDQLRVGAVLRVGGPRNTFPLVETAPHSLLIAGGIGVTPVMAMAARLESLGRSWELHYAVRQRSEAIPLDRIGGRCHLHVDEERGAVLDLAALVAGAPAGTHLYCCGPAPMLDAFERAAAARPAGERHVERFAAAPAAAGPGEGFVVELARSGKRLAVAPGQSILDAVRECGVAVEASCEQGICGSCETRVLAGTPEHRDFLLSEEERASNAVMMICCSRSLSDCLVLDL